MRDDATFTKILRAHLRLLTPEAPLESDASLAELGLQSMDSVQLLLDLEEEFGVELPDRLVSAETFATPGSLRRAFDSMVQP